MNIQKLPLDRIIFLDIETVPVVKQFSDLSNDLQDLWIHKAQRIRPEVYASPEMKFEQYAGIYAEFGKIICISMGLMYREEDSWKVRMKSLSGDDEKVLLEDFAELLSENLHPKKYVYLCGHNIREFDVPYICRRMMVHCITLPPYLHIAGKKPWELEHFLDTLTLWKFGDYKSYTSLKLLMALFGLPSPKEDIDGSQVGHVYWHEMDLSRIVRYCERDVLAVIHLLCHWSGLPSPEEKNITFSSEEN